VKGASAKASIWVKGRLVMGQSYKAVLP
jgi:hypothetical protein